MKIFTLLSIVVIFFVSCTQSASSKINPSQKNKKKQLSIAQVDQIINPEMTFDTPEWNFGVITQGDVVEHTYKFVNTGSDPLIITNAKGSCGCTVPEWPKAPVSPGEEGEIYVKYNSAGKKGKQNKKVTLTTNMTPSQQVIYVKGQVNLKQE
jgi:hypothetical protein